MLVMWCDDHVNPSYPPKAPKRNEGGGAGILMTCTVMSGAWTISLCK